VDLSYVDRESPWAMRKASKVADRQSNLAVAGK